MNYKDVRNNPEVLIDEIAQCRRRKMNYKDVRNNPEVLADEIARSDVGRLIFLNVAPPDEGYSPDGIEVLVLDPKYRVVVFRMSNDVIDGDWAIGDIDDVLEAAERIFVSRYDAAN